MGKMETAKRAIERAVSANRFNARDLLAKVKHSGAFGSLAVLARELSKVTNEKVAEVVAWRVIRFAFLIEPVNEDITSTKYDHRWARRFPDTDPRKATFDTCVDTMKKACGLIGEKLEQELCREILVLIPDWGLSPHEIPLDYGSKDRPSIHAAENVIFYDSSEYLRLLRMRETLLDKTINDSADIFAAVMDKMHVKSYLTDRAQTGEYKTNREKRWEAHPQSPQFALRRDCLEVELRLAEQLIGFMGFPEKLLGILIEKGVLKEKPAVSRCPVTLEPMKFEDLAKTAMNPEHGKSAYQVGHLNPLKAGDSPQFRHTSANISWISEDGNRIQGHLSLDATRALIRKIAANYSEAGTVKQP